MSLEDVQAVQRALEAVGSHRWVPFEVMQVERDGLEVRITLTLFFVCATPVCCGEPSCYVAFLGMKRDDVAGALAVHLDFAQPPRVSMSVRMKHEPGYQYVEPHFRAVDQTIEFDAACFAVRNS